jgi:hypothetical protein
MPRKSNLSAHQELDQLDQAVAAARRAEAQAERELVPRGDGYSTREVEKLREQIRQAHEEGRDVSALNAQLRASEQALEEAVLAKEGLAQRVRRAEWNRERFLNENGARLLGELNPECDRVVADLREHAVKLVEADRRWSTLHSIIDSPCGSRRRLIVGCGRA